MQSRSDRHASAPRELELRELVAVLRGGRGIVAGLFAGSLLAGGLYVLLAPPVYEADALVQVETEKQPLGAMLGEMAAMLGAQTPVAAELEVLRSRRVLDDVIGGLRLELLIEPRRLPLVGGAIARWRSADGANAVGGPGPYAWGTEALVLERLDVPRALVDEWLTLRATATGWALHGPDDALLAAGGVGVAASGNGPGGSVTLQVESLRAEPGTEFRIMRRDYGDVLEDLEDTLDIAERGKQSGVVGVTYTDEDPVRAARVVNTLVGAYLRQNVERRSAEAEQTLAFLETQLPKIRAELESAEAALNAFRLRQGSADLAKETELILQHGLALEAQRVQLEQSRRGLLEVLTARHPTLQALTAQLQQVEREKVGVADRVKTLPADEQDLLRLAREVQVNSDIYTLLLNSAQQLQLAKAGTVGNVRIIDYAREPTKPAFPRPGLVLALAGLLGLAAGVLGAFVLRALRHGVEDPSVVEAALGLPTYATVPYAREQRRLARTSAPGAQPLLAIAAPNEPAIEALRSLRTSLQFAAADAKSRVLAFTGPAPDLGKSFVTINLGAVLTTARKSVVIVDADLRRGRLHEYVGLARVPGVSEYVTGGAAIEDVARPTAVPGLHLVTTGLPPAQPAELLLHERFALLLAELARRYDHVLVDTPPVLAVTDATLIGRLAGATLLVLKAGAHSLREIEEAARRLRQAGVEVRGTIFNQVGAHGTGAAYAYGYGYGTPAPRRTA